MRSEELVAGGDLAAEGIAGFARHLREIHGGIAGRVFAAVGASAVPARRMHDEIADVAYEAVGRAGSGVVRAGARLAGVARRPDAPPADASPQGRFVLGALNGAFGDRLEVQRSALAQPMGVRAAGVQVPPDRGALASTFPTATPRLAVFLHGLCETEDAWRLRADRHRPYGERLRAEAGFTPLYLRYNTGLHISANGRTLATLLGELVEAWPVGVEEIALIGHSMGGLVARSACHYGAGSDAIRRVRHVFALGAPHHGAQLERVAHAAGAALHRLPETRAVARALSIRSAGIRDLYHGYLVDEDWEEFDPHAFLVAAAREIPFHETASHYFVAATVTRDPHAPLGRAVGDLLVSRPSAWAHRRPTDRLRFPIDNYRSIGAATHFDLLNHPAIADQLVRWIAGRPALPPA